jgi:hypothetical protein
VNGMRERRAGCKPSSFRRAAVKRIVAVLLLLLVLLGAHVVYWYMPRERAVAPQVERAAAPRLPLAEGGADRGGSTDEPLRLLAGGAYDVCVWVPYPHQNLGVLAAAVGDLQEVAAAAARLSAGEPAPRSREPEEPPTFGPFEVPPASEMVACSDLAGGRLRVVARIYPALSLVAKLAGRLAGNPWLAGGDAGRSHIAWNGRLWSVDAGEASPPPAAPPPAMPSSATPSSTPPAASGGALGGDIPESLALVHWLGARPEIPAGYYALTRSGSDLSLTLVGADPAGAGAAASRALSAAVAPAALLVAVGPEWRVGASSPPSSPPLPPAALALFEVGGSRVSSLGDLPGLAVFNAPGPPGSERWRLPTEGIFRLLAGRLPAAEAAGWRILALDSGSLRQAEAIAPRLAPLLPAGGAPAGGASAAGAPAAGPSSAGALAGAPAAGTPVTGVPAAGVPAAPAADAAAGVSAAGAPLSLGVWLDPRSALRMVTRVRRFVEGFPLASRRQVELWRDWETVLDPLANCEHATLAATASPPSMRLVLRACSASSTPR